MSSLRASSVAENLAQIRAVLPETTTLVAVSKQQPLGKIQEALAAGQRHFGENYAQELLEKWPSLKQQYQDVSLHFIGRLQRNKIASVLPHVQLLHTLDRESLAESLAEWRDKGNALPALLVQVNTGEEPQKAGVVPTQLPQFLQYCQDTLELKIAGLMCIPPAHENPSLHFGLLTNLGRKLLDQFSSPHLSMGMSDDYSLAVAYGATMVRIGSGVFGARAAAI